MDMCGKILITCSLVVRTGLHIGGSGIFSPIGAVDSPVIRDPLTQRPIVPGSFSVTGFMLPPIRPQGCSPECSPAPGKRRPSPLPPG